MEQKLLRTKVQADIQKFPIELRNALSSVVGLRSSVPADAFTAGTLGTEREGYQNHQPPFRHTQDPKRTSTLVVLKV